MLRVRDFIAKMTTKTAFSLAKTATRNNKVTGSERTGNRLVHLCPSVFICGYNSSLNIRRKKVQAMPHGFFTVEQWTTARGGASAQWIPILHLDAYQSLAKAVESLAKRGEPGLFRVVQMQRCIWAEVEGGKLRLHGSHASSLENLAEIVKVYEREGGRRPVEKARQQRAQAKAKRNKK